MEQILKLEKAIDEAVAQASSEILRKQLGNSVFFSHPSMRKFNLGQSYGSLNFGDRWFMPLRSDRHLNYFLLM